MFSIHKDPNIRDDSVSFFYIGRMHSAPYRGYGYVPLRFGGNVIRRTGTQQQLFSIFLLLPFSIFISGMEWVMED